MAVESRLMNVLITCKEHHSCIISFVCCYEFLVCNNEQCKTSRNTASKQTATITNNNNFKRQCITAYNSNAIMIAKLLQEMPTA